MTSRSLWNHYRYEIDNDPNVNNDDSQRVNNEKVTKSKSFNTEIAGLLE